MCDILIKNGMIVDGGGGKPYRGDVCVLGGEIARIALEIGESAARTLDAAGQVVSPGFIDAHTHDDLVMFEDPYNSPKLQQGVTTVIAGNCGFGPCPYSDGNVSVLTDYTQPILGKIAAEKVFRDFGAYADAMDRLEKGQNIASLLAHGAVYIEAKGFQDGPMTPEQVKQAQAQMQNAMEHGALGLSVGFMYAPGCYCGPESIRPLAEVVARYNGRFCVHLRSESEFVDASIGEVLAVAERTGVAAHISHLKNVGKQYRGNMAGIAAQMEKRIRDGVDITFDMYPYTVGGTTMSILFPIEMLNNGIEGCLRSLRDGAARRRLKERLRVMWESTDNLSLLCGWENVLVSSLDSEKNRDAIGKSVAEIARMRGLEPDEACLVLFEEEQGKIAILLNHMIERDMQDTILSEHCFVVSDSIPGGKSPHPRLYGTFPAFLRMFCRENKLLPIEQAVKKITSMPARRFGLGKRGLLRQGYAADIVVFNPDIITDKATFRNPQQYPEGISWVLVNGEIVCDHKTVTGRKPGRFLRYEPGRRANAL